MKSGEEFGLLAVENIQLRSDTGALIFNTQLLQSTRSMFHIDELLLWLGQQFVQRLQMQVAQCWAVQSDRQNQQSLELRAHVYKDHSLPIHIVSNDQVLLITKRIATEHDGAFFQPVEQLFPPYQTILLKRYGLHYCLGCFIQQNTLLPPPESELVPARLPSPLRLVFLFFTRHSSSQQLLPMINALAEQSLRVAKERNLLMAVYEGRVSLTPALPALFLPAVSELIPHRLEHQDLLHASPLFSNFLFIRDKKARRLYKQIDNRRPVCFLAASLHWPMNETLPLLRLLLKQQRIQLYEASGKPISTDLVLRQ
jgi:hypothetical protein